MNTTTPIPTVNFTESDIEEMVQAVIADDPDSAEIKDSLATSLNQLANGKIGRMSYPLISNTRKQTGLSQSQFAKRLGISINTLQSWEQGQRQPSGAAATLIHLLNKRPELVAELG